MAKSKYESHVLPRLEMVEGWARNGVTDEDIAKNLGVAYSTFRVYKEEHAALSAALKRSKEVADLQVEGALFRRALGYSYTEDTYAFDVDEDGKPAQKLVKRVTKEVQPDVTAQIFWLKNRLPQRWRDKPEGGDGDENEACGVVVLAPVMERGAGPQGAGPGNGGRE